MTERDAPTGTANAFAFMAAMGANYAGFSPHATAELRRVLELKRNAGRRLLAKQTRRFHAGRNDPCPCGSGRKFKHCCTARNLTQLEPEP